MLPIIPESMKIFQWKTSKSNTGFLREIHKAMPGAHK